MLVFCFAPSEVFVEHNNSLPELGWGWELLRHCCQHNHDRFNGFKLKEEKVRALVQSLLILCEANQMLATFLTLQMLSTQPPVSNDKSACPYNWYAVLCYVSLFFAFDGCAPHHLFLFGCLSTDFLLRRYPLSFQFSLFPFFHRQILLTYSPQHPTALSRGCA